VTTAVLFDPIFFVPFVNGLLLALLLPVLGTYARLRGELLASLGVAQMAAAGIGLGAFLGTNLALSALLATLGAAGVKSSIGRRAGNDAYAAMLLAGWSLALLLAANTTRGDELARALLEGQIYFTDTFHLRGIATIGIASAPLLRWLSPRLLLGCLFPEHFAANGIHRPRHDQLFDILMAVTLAFSATVVGVMGAFALVVVPPWVAFRFARGWRQTVWLSAAIGVTVYVATFALAIIFDQPYGPVLVLLLLVAAFARLGRRR
jgi:zinc/manganese transport system permease protein